MSYDKRHGSPYDRGSCDKWYQRPPTPHYFIGESFSSEMVEADAMTEDEKKAYFAGYDSHDDHKEFD